ncbi:hypothetical protein LTS18_014798, partial [Coniosporium uncinatum]
MAFLSAPSTPDHVPSLAHPGMGRRSFTVPTQLAQSPKSSPGGLSDPPDSVDTLFTHAHAKVVSFSTPSNLSRPGSSSGRGTAEARSQPSEKLPWTSSSERTIAAGPLRIYRVPSSGVSFLHSGPLLHPILPKAQCWCVDTASKFVLRIRDGSYYRIELPVDADDSSSTVDDFKAVLAKVLQYEKTPCPFRGEVAADDPASPSTPVRRRSLGPTSKARKWHLKGRWMPEDVGGRFGAQAEMLEEHTSEEDDRGSAGTVEGSEYTTQAKEIAVQHQGSTPELKT